MIILKDDFLPEIEIIGTQESNLNGKQIDSARSFLSNVYGNVCGAGCDLTTGCGRSPSELETLWKAKFIQKNLPIPERKAPFLIVNEKKGRGLHRTVNGKFDAFGNVNYFCKTCNMIYDRRMGDIKVTEKATATFQARKSHEVRPRFKTELPEYLKRNTHGCFNEIMNKWSDEYICSQELLKNTYDQIFDLIVDEIEIVDFGIKCEYGKCNGTHIIIKGEPPVVDMTKQDLDVFLSEMKERHKDDDNDKKDPLQ